MYICKYTVPVSVLQFYLIVLISKWLNVFNPGVKRDHVRLTYSAALYIHICWVFLLYLWAMNVKKKRASYAQPSHNKAERCTATSRQVRTIFSRPFTSVHLPRGLISLFTTSHEFFANQTHIVRVSMVSTVAQRRNPRFATNCVKLCVGSLVGGFTFHRDDLVDSKLWRHAARARGLQWQYSWHPLWWLVVYRQITTSVCTVM